MQLTQLERERIAAVHAALELARMTAAIQHDNFTWHLQALPVGLGLARHTHADPLPGNGVTIFEAAITDIARVYTGKR